MKRRQFFWRLAGLTLGVLGPSQLGEPGGRSWPAVSTAEAAEASSRWIGSPHYAKGRSGHRPLAIVNHVAEGSLANVDAWFNNPKSRVSSHFCVGKQGEIHQYVSTPDMAWANGPVARPDLSIPWLAEAVERGINPNHLTIAIEREGFSAEVPSERQYQSLLALHRYCLSTYGIPATRERIIGHYQIDSISRAGCPGNFPWARLLADLARSSA